MSFLPLYTLDDAFSLTLDRRIVNDIKQTEFTQRKQQQPNDRKIIVKPYSHYTRTQWQMKGQQSIQRQKGFFLKNYNNKKPIFLSIIFYR